MNEATIKNMTDRELAGYCETLHEDETQEYNKDRLIVLVEIAKRFIKEYT